MESLCANGGWGGPPKLFLSFFLSSFFFLLSFRTGDIYTLIRLAGRIVEWQNKTGDGNWCMPCWTVWSTVWGHMALSVFKEWLRLKRENMAQYTLALLAYLMICSEQSKAQIRESTIRSRMAALQFVFDLSGVSLDEIAAVPLGEIAKRLNVETPRLDEDAAIEDGGASDDFKPEDVWQAKLHILIAKAQVDLGKLADPDWAKSAKECLFSKHITSFSQMSTSAPEDGSKHVADCARDWAWFLKDLKNFLRANRLYERSNRQHNVPGARRQRFTA